MDVLPIISHFTKVPGIATRFQSTGVTVRTTSNIQKRVIKPEKRGGSLSTDLNRSPCCAPPSPGYLAMLAAVFGCDNQGQCVQQAMTDRGQGCCETSYSPWDSPGHIELPSHKR